MFPLLVAVLTIAGGGVVAAFVAHFTALARADREYKLRKLEEVLISLEYVETADTQTYMWFISKFGAAPIKTEKPDVDGQEVGKHFFGLVSICRLLFPELECAMDRWKSARHATAEAQVTGYRKKTAEAASLLNTRRTEQRLNADEFRKRIFLVGSAVRNGAIGAWLRSVAPNG